MNSGETIYIVNFAPANFVNQPVSPHETTWDTWFKNLATALISRCSADATPICKEEVALEAHHVMKRSTHEFT